MKLTDLISMQDRRNAAILDDVLDAFSERHLPRNTTDILVHAYVVRAHYRRRSRRLRLIRGKKTA